MIDNPAPAIGDWFGFSIAISGDRLVVGAPRDDGEVSNAGRAYVYDLSSSTPALPTQVVANPAPAISDEFGCAVAVSGPHLVVAAWLDDGVGVDAGDVRIYDLTTAFPSTPVASLTWQDPAAEDFFDRP